VLGTTVGDVPDIVVPNKCLDVSVHGIATEANNKMLGQWNIQLVPVGETRRADEPGHYLSDFPSKLLCQLHRVVDDKWRMGSFTGSLLYRMKERGAVETWR